jgi:hypothetical protein
LNYGSVLDATLRESNELFKVVKRIFINNNIIYVTLVLLQQKKKS